MTRAAPDDHPDEPAPDGPAVPATRPVRGALRDWRTFGSRRYRRFRTLAVAQGFIGALSVRHGTVRRYSPDEVQLLSRIADQAAIAVTNARLHESMQALSLTAPLTQLPNRRHLEMFLTKEFAAARRGRRLAVVLYDLDNFKAYNDSAGHQAGDDALRAFGAVLARNTRAMNISARYGGDEFITVLTDVDRRGTLRHVERIAQVVADDPLLGPAGIRASAGMALYSERHESPEALIRAADRDLYRRKPAAGPPALPPGRQRAR